MARRDRQHSTTRGNTTRHNTTKHNTTRHDIRENTLRLTKAQKVTTQRITLHLALCSTPNFFRILNPPTCAPAHPRTHSPTHTHLHTYTPTHLQGKSRLLKCNACTVTFFPGADFHAPRVVFPPALPMGKKGAVHACLFSGVCQWAPGTKNHILGRRR